MRDFGEEAAARRRRIALVGLRGAGKTTLGSALAAELRVPFVELDREIEREAGIGLSEVFLLYGQTGYRRIERRCLERVIDAHAEMVMTVGGGIVSEPDTYNLLLRHCFTVWVKASPDEHMARVVAQGDLRPMQGNAEAMDDLQAHPRRARAAVPEGGRHARHLRRGRRSRASPSCARPSRPDAHPRRTAWHRRTQPPRRGRRDPRAAASSPTTRTRTATRTGSSRSTARSRR